MSAVHTKVRFLLAAVAAGLLIAASPSPDRSAPLIPECQNGLKASTTKHKFSPGACTKAKDGDKCRLCKENTCFYMGCHIHDASGTFMQKHKVCPD